MALQAASTVFKPLIRVAQRGAPVPDIRTKFKAPWPSWETFEYIPEDATLNIQNPKDGIDTKDHGEIDSLPTGDSSIGLSLATVRPRAIDLTRAYNLVQQVVTALAEGSSLALTAGNTATTAVTVTVRLDPGTGTLTDYAISIPAGQTADQAAATIRATAFTGYTTGGTGSTVTFRATTTGPRVDAAFVGAGSVAGIMTTNPQARPAYEHYYFDPHAETNFMVCLEGYAAAGGLQADPRITRVFLWNVEQVSEGGGGRRRGGGGGGGGRRRGGGGGAGSPGEAKFGWSNEGVFTAAYTLKAQPEPNRDTIIANTGYDAAPTLDPARRMDWYNIDAATLVA